MEALFIDVVKGWLVNAPYLIGLKLQKVLNIKEGMLKMNKTKKCKKCMSEIDKKATVCPNCRSKQVSPIAVIFVIICFIIIGTAIASSGDNEKSESTGKNNTQTVYSIGETFKTSKYEITIDSVKEKTKVGTQYLNSTPADGGVYVAVEFSYKNISDEPIGMFNFPSINLIDSKGTKYSYDVSASSYYATETDPDRKIVSDLNPGIKVKDSKVFEISKEDYANGEWKISIKTDKTENYIKIK